MIKRKLAAASAVFTLALTLSAAMMLSKYLLIQKVDTQQVLALTVLEESAVYETAAVPEIQMMRFQDETTDSIVKTAEPQIIKYQVKSGDTLASIASQYNIKVSTIAQSNNINQSSTLKEGQELQFPSIDGVLHKVSSGENMWDIASTYNIDMDKIIDINKMDSPDKLKIGQQIIIPGADKLMAVQKVKTNATGKSMKLASRGTSSLSSAAWPVQGHGYVSSRFGSRDGEFHKGVDIASAKGTNIYASMDGKVEFSGWDNGGYGYLIIIDHGNGIETYYGHNSKLLVKEGDYVAKGQHIAEMGSTGDSTGPHSHFEIRINGKPVNPLKYIS